MLWIRTDCSLLKGEVNLNLPFDEFIQRLLFWLPIYQHAYVQQHTRLHTLMSRLGTAESCFCSETSFFFRKFYIPSHRLVLFYLWFKFFSFFVFFFASLWTRISSSTSKCTRVLFLHFDVKCYTFKRQQRRGKTNLAFFHEFRRTQWTKLKQVVFLSRWLLVKTYSFQRAKCQN